MLVPVIVMVSSERSKPRAATTAVPLAPTSGLNRPSLVGPRLELGCAAFAVRSMFATAISRSAQASELIIRSSVYEPGVKGANKTPDAH